MKAHTTILLSIAILLLGACRGSNTEAANEHTIYTDDYGREVSIPVHPHRVVSLSPAVTEIVFALGADSLLVGRTDFCTYPPSATELPSIGGISNLNVERIVSMQPDLIICGSMVGKKYTDQFDQMGIPLVCVIEKPTFDGLYTNIDAIGDLIGSEDAADSLEQLMHEKVKKLAPLGDEVSSVYYVVGFGAGGNFTAGGNTFINDIIRMGGGQNIAEGVEGWSYSLEALLDKDPDYIIVRREDSAAFVATKPYNSLSAVKNGHIIGIESGTLDLQVPRNIDAILYLRRQMSK